MFFCFIKKVEKVSLQCFFCKKPVKVGWKESKEEVLNLTTWATWYYHFYRKYAVVSYRRNAYEKIKPLLNFA